MEWDLWLQRISKYKLRYIEVRGDVHGPYTALTPAIVKIQSNLVISNSLISNYRLSRSENLVPVLTWNYDNR